MQMLPVLVKFGAMLHDKENYGFYLASFYKVVSKVESSLEKKKDVAGKWTGLEQAS